MQRSLILIVDDEPVNIRTLAGMLRDHYRLLVATSGASALKLLEQQSPDLMIVDIIMPEIDGLTLARSIRKMEHLDHSAIIFLTADSHQHTLNEAMSIGGSDYIIKPVDANMLTHRVANALRRVSKGPFQHLYEEARHIMQSYFESAEHHLLLSDVLEIADKLVTLLTAPSSHLSDFLDLLPKSYDDASHNINVAILAIMLGRTLNMSRRQLHDLGTAGILHDCGKTMIDRAILEKNSQLSWYEYTAVQEHARFSVEIAKRFGIRSTAILSAILYHHEKLDGSGYPEGISAAAIPQFAQILAVCDIFDALTTDRSFRERYSSFEALRLMKLEMSAQLNTTYIDTLIRMLR